MFVNHSSMLVILHLTQSYIGIESSICRSANLVTSKMGAGILLRGILDLEIDEDAIPDPDPDEA